MSHNTSSRLCLKVSEVVFLIYQGQNPISPAKILPVTWRWQTRTSYWTHHCWPPTWSGVRRPSRCWRSPTGWTASLSSSPCSQCCWAPRSRTSALPYAGGESGCPTCQGSGPISSRGQSNSTEEYRSPQSGWHGNPGYFLRRGRQWAPRRGNILSPQSSPGQCLFMVVVRKERNSY